MRVYARVLDGRVMELLPSESDPSERFHPTIVWVPVPDADADTIAVNWIHDAGAFAPPSIDGEP